MTNLSRSRTRLARCPPVVLSCDIEVRDDASPVVVRQRARLRAASMLLFLPAWQLTRFHKGLMTILLGCFGQPDKSPISTVWEEVRGV